MTKDTARPFSAIIFAPKLWPNSMLRVFKVLSVIFAIIIIHESLAVIGPSSSIAHADKIMHALAYAVLTGAMRLGWPFIWGGFLVIGASALGVGLELAQAVLVQGRTGSIGDALANMSGAFIAVAILYPLRLRTSP